MQFDNTRANNLILITKDEVPTFWHVIKAGLDYMVKEGRNPDGWMPATVFKDLYEGRATCVFTSIARSATKKRGKKAEAEAPTLYETREQAIEDSCGFGIVTVRETARGKTFHIWIAVSNETTNKKQAPSILTTFHKEVWELAKACGCTHIAFGTNQDWWDDLAPRFGFTKQEVIWTTEIK
ncbi:hypothetical protein AWB76_00915 [Caballeronia temeraria]|uniref:N-acetyltransferase domain-containing protein n=1 Tax=Caballeronia temeraria TaxID=1777137 RepID=A0A157ZLQ6_9BURK|nr:hypothetical protein [Caballeronia temeraria]SAK46450.1 hypothetical protein AWB76_00915 [Caballeronia temeraria]